jgi:excisionase family DNA binding protein
VERPAPSATTNPVAPDTSAEPLLTVDDVARMLNVRKSWVYIKTTETRELPSLKIGRFLRFRRSDIEAYIRGQRRGVEVAQ